MLNLRPATILAAVWLSSFSGSSQVAAGAEDQIIHFNAKWWNQANSDEQEGFIDGYLDCLQPPKSQSPAVVIEEYEESISRTLQTHPQESVTEAIHHAQLTLKAKEVFPPRDNAEVWSGPHGFFNGGWWGEFEIKRPQDAADQDKGYLEGYLQCFAPPVTAKTVTRYQEMINRHYASGKHGNDSIAVVLQHLIKASNKN